MLSNQAAPAVQRAPLSGVRVSDASPILGAEVTGLNVTDDAAVDAFWDQMQALLRDRQAIVFRGQKLDHQSLEHFGRRFGAFEMSLARLADGSQKPAVHVITNFDKDGKPSRSPFVNTNYYWHSDRSNFPNGSAMVMLHGQELPPTGGDTQFSNLVLAYEGLSDADKALVSNLRAVHSFEYKRLTLEKKPMTDAERATMPSSSTHPLVRTDPDTGRKNLYIGMYACEIEGMPTDEARALIKRLEDHATQPQYVYTHTWRDGDFIIWDNLSLMHRALKNYEMENYRRVMLRCGIKSNRRVQ